ncbi:hypothetical protein ACIBCU_14655 [Streptomyces sp. NPDC051064]|uniref:hypothetical protein n=1 Tax=Streptomyces sp. NPDC051064 TaxID=3365641 RepID=UPI0037A753F1
MIRRRLITLRRSSGGVPSPSPEDPDDPEEPEAPEEPEEPDDPDDPEGPDVGGWRGTM